MATLRNANSTAKTHRWRGLCRSPSQEGREWDKALQERGSQAVVAVPTRPGPIRDVFGTGCGKALVRAVISG